MQTCNAPSLYMQGREKKVLGQYTWIYQKKVQGQYTWIYHLVKDTIRNPRNRVSSRSGARTPVIPTKNAVLATENKQDQVWVSWYRH
jgi:hypothetical protein